MFTSIVAKNIPRRHVGGVRRWGTFLAISKQHDTGFFAGLDGLFVPDGGLDFTDVRLAEHEHRHARLADPSAYRKGQLAV